MEQSYFLTRRKQELDAAIGAVCSEARIIHLDLAKRYAVKAAEAADDSRSGTAYGVCDDRRLRFVA